MLVSNSAGSAGPQTSHVHSRHDVTRQVNKGYIFSNAVRFSNRPLQSFVSSPLILIDLAVLHSPITAMIICRKLFFYYFK